MPVKTKLAGVNQQNADGTSRQQILAEMRRDGSKDLTLRHEPENQYSEHAIAVYNARGEQLGYLRDALAADAIEIIQERGSLHAEVLNISGGTGGKNYGCNIVIPHLEFVEEDDEEEEEEEEEIILRAPSSGESPATESLAIGSKVLLWLILGLLAWIILK